MPVIGRPVVIDWPLSSYFGWGLFGLNLMQSWARRGGEPLLTTEEVNEANLDLNPVEWAMLRSSLAHSRDLRARLEPHHGKLVALDVPVLHALGADLAPGPRTVTVGGKPSLGFTFFEGTAFSPASREHVKAYAAVAAASQWNRRVLEENGFGPVALVPQGVDPTVFHAAPKAGWFAGRFAVFSGGKLEYRKGQDLVIKAFRAFAARHADALLVTAWASPWPQLAHSLGGDPQLAAVPFAPDGRPDPAAWAVANGIAPGQFIDLGAVPNSAMGRVYREMDAGLFPNRCEGGTNQVAMECMACGVPAILSSNTGHLDLIAPDRCFPLERQTPVAAAGCEGWGESDVEEIVETLEAIREHRRHALERAARGASFMRDMTWDHTAGWLADVLAPLL